MVLGLRSSEREKEREKERIRESTLKFTQIHKPSITKQSLTKRLTWRRVP